jgi:hypothetical protein
MFRYDIYGSGEALSIELSDYPDKTKVCYHYEMVLYFNAMSGYEGRLSEEYDCELVTDKFISLDDLEIKDEDGFITICYEGKDIRFR